MSIHGSIFCMAFAAGGAAHFGMWKKNGYAGLTFFYAAMILILLTGELVTVIKK